MDVGSNPAAVIRTPAGPLTGAVPINGLTATTNLSCIADLIPSHARMGEMLVMGLDGPITTTLLASIAESASSVATGVSLYVRSIPCISSWPFARIQKSWKWIRPMPVLIMVVTSVSVIGRTFSRTPNRSHNTFVALVSRMPLRSISPRAIWTARSLSPIAINSSRPSRLVSSCVVNVSPRIPHQVSVLRIPEKRYITVSRSGEMWFPEIQMSSAVLTMTDISWRSITFCIPLRSFGVPVPPDRKVIITTILLCDVYEDSLVNL
jgi:hypothetical protein